MTYDVVFSLEATAELLRIALTIRPATSVVLAADSIRKMLEQDPHRVGHALSEGLFFVDEEPLRAFFVIDEDARQVEITDFRIL